MKIRHRVPTIQPRSAVVSPKYEAEVQRATQAGERRFLQAQQRLAKAEARRAQLLGKRVRESERRLHERRLREATDLVELRRDELDQLARMMQASPAGAVHRGDRSYRPVPPTIGGHV